MAKRGFFNRKFGRQGKRNTLEQAKHFPTASDAAPGQVRAGWLLQPGQLLVDNYQIGEMIGSPGGMGQVYFAKDLRLRQPVAIKVPSLAIMMAPNGANAFLEEARYAAQLRPHQHIVLINACLTDPNFKVTLPSDRREAAVPFVVMEYLGGGDLAQELRIGPMALEEAGNIFQKVCQAVQYAHTFVYERDGKQQRGIIHRDLKPQNICFDHTRRPVVVDFGLARVLEDPSTSGGIKGTPTHMAPEQWNPSRGIDHRTDIYALGVILFEMLTGRLPFKGNSIEEYLSLHLNEPPPDPREWRPDLSDAIAEAILKALQKEKEDRFNSAEGFADAANGLESSGGEQTTRIQRCSFCDQHVQPDKLGDKLFCSNCGRDWMPAEETGQGDDIHSRYCRICGQTTRPDIILGRQYCSNCGVSLTEGTRQSVVSETSSRAGDADTEQIADGTAPRSACPSCGATSLVTISGRNYCESCGLALQG